MIEIIFLSFADSLLQADTEEYSIYIKPPEKQDDRNIYKKISSSEERDPPKKHYKSTSYSTYNLFPTQTSSPLNSHTIDKQPYNHLSTEDPRYRTIDTTWNNLLDENTEEIDNYHQIDSIGIPTTQYPDNVYQTDEPDYLYKDITNLDNHIKSDKKKTNVMGILKKKPKTVMKVRP